MSNPKGIQIKGPRWARLKIHSNRDRQLTKMIRN